MENEVLVEVKGLSKKFSRNLKSSLWYGLKEITNTLLGLKGNKSKLQKDEFWALRDINFQVKRGECLGLIGHNGAGKSTLLKILNGLIRPDEGSVTMRGKVGALIELGAGFNPILTGRENIYVNGQLIGFSKKEIDEKLQAILDFAEIGEFIDSPIQNYSSGMKVRLGFAIAAQMEPDILLIDEVLAVGDIGFVLKCFNKMDYLRSKTAMIYVSHSMPQVGRMCTDILLVNKGESFYQSREISAGILKYYELFKNELGNFQGSNKVEVKKIILSSKGIGPVLNETFTMQYGDELKIEIELDFKESMYQPKLSLAFYDKEQRVFAQADNFCDHLQIEKIFETTRISTTIPNILFAQGIYSITITLFETKNNIRETILRLQSAIYFNVNGKLHGWAPIQLNPVWKIEQMFNSIKLE